MSKFKMADNVNVNEQALQICEEEHLKMNGSIATFLIVADLEQFQAAFQSEGVMKVEHIIDVTEEDLIKIGEYKIIDPFIQ